MDTEEELLAEEELLTPRELIQLLKVSNQTLTNWRGNGKGPPWIKISGEIGVPGGEVRYPRARFNAWLQTRRVHPRPGAQKEPVK
jgi:helix-turn-helix protein